VIKSQKLITTKARRSRRKTNTDLLKFTNSIISYYFRKISLLHNDFPSCTSCLRGEKFKYKNQAGLLNQPPDNKSY